MNTIVTSKEEILKTSREMIRQQGWSAISIRSVAAACGVSVGSIYNYFDSKSDLVGATVESVWCEIFHRPDNDAVFRDVQVCVTWIYERMAYGGEQYPGSSPSIPSASWEKRSPTESGACRKPGITFFPGCATCLGRMKKSGLTLLRISSPRKNSPTCCFP